MIVRMSATRNGMLGTGIYIYIYVFENTGLYAQNAQAHF